MPKFLVEFDEKKCIGSGVCEAVCPEFWVLKENRKAMLKGSRKNEQTGLFELMVDEKDAGCNRLAADGCPPGCIKVKNMETGEYEKLGRD